MTKQKLNENRITSIREKWKTSKAQLLAKQSLKGELKEKLFLKKNKKTWLESTCKIHGPVMRPR